MRSKRHARMTELFLVQENIRGLKGVSKLDIVSTTVVPNLLYSREIVITATSG